MSSPSQPSLLGIPAGLGGHEPSEGVGGRVARQDVAVGTRVKPEACAAVRSLRDAGVAVWLVTGDAAGVARAVARTVGIPEDGVRAEVLPAGKAAVVAELPRAAAVPG